ncbi:hypothetical protein [Photorhabdus sp. SF281]|uniref:hypothetical protein n=1 Tax=Photorhabdus sp. SF281 TaxID=3459527 RepID=UPI0040439713
MDKKPEIWIFKANQATACYEQEHAVGITVVDTFRHDSASIFDSPANRFNV